MVQFVIQQTLPCKNLDNKDRIKNVVSFLRFVPLLFLLQASLLNAGLEYSRSDLVSKQHILRNNFIFGMPYLIFEYVMETK